MPVLRDLTYARPTRSYAGAPIEELNQLGATLETRYNQNKLQAQKTGLLLNNLDVRDINRPIVDEEIAKYKDKLKAISDAGNYENLGNELDILANDFANNRLVNKALEDKQKHTAYKGQIETMYKEGKIDYDTYQNTLKYSEKQNNKSLVFNPVTKSYDNVFSGFNPAEYQDISKAMFDTAKDWKAKTEPFTVTYTKNGKEIQSQIIRDPLGQGFVFAGTTKSVPEEELQSALTTAVMNNPKYMAYINQNLMFMKQNKLATRPSGQIYESDIVSSNPADGALLGMSKDEFKKQLEAAGYKYDEMMADTEMREAIYDSMYRKKVINDYVNPAVQKEGYKEIDLKLYDDKVFLENLKAANDLKLQRQKAADDMNLERLKNSFEKERALSYIDSQPGTLINNPFTVEKMPSRISELDNSIKLLEQDMKSGAVDHATGVSRLRAYQDEKLMLQNRLNATQTKFLDTPEGNSFLKNKYEDYKKATIKIGKPVESFEWFKQEVLKPNFADLAHNTETKTINSFGPSGMLHQNKSTSDRANILANTWRELKTKSDKKIQNDSQEGKSSYSNVLTSADPKSEISLFNKTITQSLNNNMKDYLAWTPEGMKTFDDIRKKYADKDIRIEGAANDAPIYDTWYVQGVIIDNKTNQILDTYELMPKDQNTASQMYYDLNLKIAQNRGNDVYGNKAKQNLAHIEFPDLKTSSLNLELATVDQNSPVGAKAFSTVKDVGGNKIIIVREKVSVPIFGENNNVEEYTSSVMNKFYMAKPSVSAGTKITNDNLLENVPNGELIPLKNPRYANDPIAKKYKLDILFPSIEDGKSAFFDLKYSTK